MFRAHRAHHQERQILSLRPLVTAILKTGENTIQTPIDTKLQQQMDAYYDRLDNKLDRLQQQPKDIIIIIFIFHLSIFRYNPRYVEMVKCTILVDLQFDTDKWRQST
jgi:hypothetical protein